MDDLFPGNSLLYDRKCEEWVGVFETFAAMTEGWYTPWFERFANGKRMRDGNPFVNGKKMRDGNPIFSGICRSQLRGVSVIQWQRENSNDHYDFVCYFDLFDGRELDLVIHCCTEPTSEARAKEIMREWILWDTKSPLPKSLQGYAEGHDWEKWWKTKI